MDHPISDFDDTSKIREIAKSDSASFEKITSQLYLMLLNSTMLSRKEINLSIPTWIGNFFVQEPMLTILSDFPTYKEIFLLTETEFINDINKIIDPSTNKTIDKLESDKLLNIRKFIRSKGDIHSENNIYFYGAILLNYQLALNLLLSIDDFNECINNNITYLFALINPDTTNLFYFLIETKNPLANKLELAFILAAAHGLTEIVIYLISYGVNVNCYDNTAFSMAVLRSHLPIIKLLLQSGASINKFYDYTSISDRLSRFDNDTFICAIISDNAEIIQLLIDLGCDVRENIFALTFAIIHNSKNSIKILIENGMDYHMKNDLAFMTACSHDRIEMIKYFLELGINNVSLFESYFSYEYECDYYSVETIQFLLDYLRKLNLSNQVLNSNDGAPLKKFFGDIKTLFNSSIITIDDRHYYQMTDPYTLRYMAIILKLLIYSGANINEFLDQLYLVVLLDDLELFNIFIDSGAVTYQNDIEVLQNAISTGSISITKYLLESNSDIHCHSENLLCAAILNLNNEMIKLLTDAGLEMELEKVKKIFPKECRKYSLLPRDFVLEFKGNRIEQNYQIKPSSNSILHKIGNQLYNQLFNENTEKLPIPKSSIFKSLSFAGEIFDNYQDEIND